jgi:hypothetical protein
MKKFVVILAVFVVVSVSLLIISGKWYFWEPSNFTKDSWAYQLKVSYDVKEFPIWQPVADPRYLVRTADGVKRSVVVMQYQTTLTKSVLFQQLKQRQFTCGNGLTRGNFRCERVDEIGREISVRLHRLDTEKKVEIRTTFLGF